MAQETINNTSEQKEVQEQMEDKNKPWWLDILQRQGLAVLLVLAVAGYTGYYIIPSVGSFAKETWTWHKETVDKVTDNVEKQTDINKEFAKAQEETVRIQEQTARAIEENTKVLKEITEKQIPILDRIDKGIQNLRQDHPPIISPPDKG